MSRRRRVTDRRPVELVNQIGDGPALVLEQLPAWSTGRFAAQLRLWRAACAYEREITMNVTYGLPVQLETRLEWENARIEWQPWLRLLQRPLSTRPHVATLSIREDLL